MSSPTETAAPAESPPITEPLPLVAFERYMLADDSADYPMLPVTELVFEGHFNRAAFESAVERGLARNTLLRSRVVDHRGKPCWLYQPSAWPQIEWTKDCDDTNDSITPPIDLRQEIGLRLHLREHGNQTSLLIQNHHACADGDGVAQFVEDLLYGYAELTDPNAGSLKFRKLDQSRLHGRGAFVRESSAPPPPRTWRDHWRSTRDSLRFVTTRPVALASPHGRVRGQSAALSHRHLLTRRLSTDQSTAIRQAALAHGVQVNDYVLGCLMMTLARWNEQHSSLARRSSLRILMPTNLRSRGDLRTPGVNLSSFAFVTRTAADLADRAALLQGIAAETQYIQRNRVGLEFINSVGLLLAIPGALPAILKHGGCVATAVLSYIGDHARRIFKQLPRDNGRVVAGDVIMDQVYFSPPVRSQTRLAIGMTNYVGRMHLGLKCDPWLFTAHDAQRLLDAVVGQILQGTETSTIPAV
ncbi:MAG TPA: hypothetical protein VG713_01955 [Pirellulales bacterium]|nr:hypothetical protein [Pirellulales bacterium]